LEVFRNMALLKELFVVRVNVLLRHSKLSGSMVEKPSISLKCVVAKSSRTKFAKLRCHYNTKFFPKRNK